MNPPSSQHSVKERRTLDIVKFGYVVFEQKFDAQRLLKEGSINLGKENITISLAQMCRERGRTIS